MAGLPLFLLRTLHLLTSITILALSVNAIQVVRDVRAICAALDRCPDLKGLGPAVSFATFAGAWAVLDAVLGLASLWVDKVPGKVVLGVDGLGAVFALAGGIRFAVLFGMYPCGVGNTYCDRLIADTALLFLGAAVTLAAIAVSLLSQRGGKKGSEVVEVGKERGAEKGGSEGGSM